MNEVATASRSIDQLETFVTAILTGAGASPEDAAIVAREVVDAEARGYESQGVMRVASYAAAAGNGSTVSPTRLELIRESPSALVWDAHNGWGHVSALRAIAECAARAKTTGACVGTIRNIGHIGRLGYYVEAAADLGVIGFISCSGNMNSATVAPWGGREPRLSTNPFAYGFPYPGGDSVVVDISTTQAARGKVLVAATTGQSIPETWALDANGVPTSDPNHALPPNGTLAPLGGHKGYALSIAVELLCGGLGGHYPPGESTVFVAAYAPGRLTTEDEYAAAVAEIDASMRSSARRHGFDAIRLPGAGSAERRRRAESEGLTVNAELWQGLCAVADSVGVNPPSVAE
jgi:LDH2 family malate/lactate/ureidoglycolate dehydrogenase